MLKNNKPKEHDWQNTALDFSYLYVSSTKKIIISCHSQSYDEVGAIEQPTLKLQYTQKKLTQPLLESTHSAGTKLMLAQRKQFRGQRGWPARLPGHSDK